MKSLTHLRKARTELCAAIDQANGTSTAPQIARVLVDLDRLLVSLDPDPLNRSAR